MFHKRNNKYNLFYYNINHTLGSNIRELGQLGFDTMSSYHITQIVKLISQSL